VLLADLFAQCPILTPQELALLGLAQSEHHLILLERLLDVVVGSGLHRLDRQVRVPVGAHDDDRGIVPLGFERGQQVQTTHLRHAHVGEDTVGPEGVDQGEPVFSAGRRLHLVAVAAQQRSENHPDVLLVIDNQNPSHCAKNARRHPGRVQRVAYRT
jgi:hypothetical protein